MTTVMEEIKRKTNNTKGNKSSMTTGTISENIEELYDIW